MPANDPPKASFVERDRAHSWAPLVAAALAALALFSFQQLYFELQDARGDAAVAARSMAAFLVARTEGHIRMSAQLLREAAVEFPQVIATEYCQEGGCIEVHEGAAMSLPGALDWRFSLCAGRIKE